MKIVLEIEKLVFKMHGNVHKNMHFYVCKGYPLKR